MDARFYFVLGSKLIGLYCLVLAVIYFVPVIGSFFSRTDQRGPTDYFAIIYFALILTPVLLTGIGLYLIKDGALVHNLAFPENGSELTVGMESLFTLAIKLYGVFLTASSLPPLLKVLSNFIFFANMPYDFSNTVADSLGIKTDFLPYLSSLLLGIYFVLRGERVTRLAFRNAKSEIGE